MRRFAFVSAFTLAVLLGAGLPAGAQTFDLAECRASCQQATVAARELCTQLAGPAKRYCARAARAYNRCCKRKFCRGRVADVAECVRTGF